MMEEFVNIFYLNNDIFFLFSYIFGYYFILFFIPPCLCTYLLLLLLLFFEFFYLFTLNIYVYYILIDLARVMACGWIFNTMMVGFLAIFLCTHIESKKTNNTNTIESGKLYLQVKQTSTSSAQPFQLSYDSSIKSELKLTQSSKIQIEAKMKFGSSTFEPQLFTFRLVHTKYDKLTQPVQATYDSQSQSWKCVVDLGDPRTIQSYSDLYKLEIIIADQRLQQNVRNQIASIRVSFRHSIPEQKIPNNNSPINYNPPNIIRTNPPEQRIDPPAVFTIFVVILMGIFTLILLYGIFGYLKANFRLLPSNTIGLILNISLIGLLVVNLSFLFKFWLEWNFITTIINFFWLFIVTALVGNYALLYMKNKK